MTELHETARRIVSQEVRYCVSALVSTLAKGYGLGVDLGDELADLCEQAFELSCPVPDYESAARDAGYEFYSTTGKFHFKEQYEDQDGCMLINYDTAEEVCNENDIEPYDSEIYEYWAISDWLADRLIEKGEKVDKDFAGLTVWGRQTTGQAIYADSVIEAIARDLMA